MHKNQGKNSKVSLSPCNCWNVDSFPLPPPLSPKDKRPQIAIPVRDRGALGMRIWSLIQMHTQIHVRHLLMLPHGISASPDLVHFGWDIQSVWYLMERKVLCGWLSDWFLVLPLDSSSHTCGFKHWFSWGEDAAHFLHLLLRGCFLCLLTLHMCPHLLMLSILPSVYA